MRVPPIAVLLTLLLCGIPAAASAPQSAPTDATTVIQRMVSSEPALLSYRARVHVDVHMLNFPYLSPTLDGTSYYKRPASYEVVFDSVPFYLKSFSRLFADMGQPQAWERDQDVVLVGTRVENGRPLLHLRMTKKIHSDILDHTDAYVDPQTYELLRMEWHYTSGGTIVMTQTYRKDGAFFVPSAQHASIDIPHVRAVGDAVYKGYQINVSVNNAVFTK